MLSRGGACPVARQLALALNSAAKRRDPEAAVAIFESHAASAGGALPLQSYNTVLALLTDHPSERARVRQHMREHKVRADETTVTLDVRSLVARGDVDAALAALSEAEASGVSPKRRTYSAVLTALCDSGDVGRSEALVGQMRRAAVEPGEDDIVQLAALLASAGERGRLEGALECLQRAVPQLQPASFARLQASLDAPTEGLKTRHAAVDAAGRCDSCGEVLAAVDLTSDQRAHMRVALLDAAEATGGDNLQGDLQRDLRRDLRRDLERFGDWVASRWAVSQGGGPRYIIDGANVAYRNQNFVGGGFSFEQVEIARRDLAAAGGAEPVLVLPARYLAAGQVPNHTKCALAKAASSQGQEDASPGRAASGASLAVAAGHARSESGHGHGGYTAVTERDAALVSRWREAGALWTCPDEASDDRYWMLAAALGGETARVLTNDEMRDHAFRLAAPGSGTAHQPAATARDVHAGDGRTQAVVPGWFHRWRARVLVRFDFSHSAAPGRPEPTLLTRHPPPFSLEIQRGLAAWHFPRATDQAWLCATGFGPPAASGATAAHGGAVEVDVQDRRPAEDGGLTGAGDVSAKRPRRDPP